MRMPASSLRGRSGDRSQIHIYKNWNFVNFWGTLLLSLRMIIRVMRRRRVILVSNQCPSWPACWRARRPAGTTHLDWRLPVTRPCYAVDWGSRCCIREAVCGRFVQPLAGYGFLGSTSATQVPRSLVSAELSIGCLLILLIPNPCQQKVFRGIAKAAIFWVNW